MVYLCRYEAAVTNHLNRNCTTNLSFTRYGIFGAHRRTNKKLGPITTTMAEAAPPPHLGPFILMTEDVGERYIIVILEDRFY